MCSRTTRGDVGEGVSEDRAEEEALGLKHQPHEDRVPELGSGTANAKASGGDSLAHSVMNRALAIVTGAS